MFIRSLSPVGRAQCGVMLVELVLFIVVVSVAVGGIVMAMNLNARHSADPLIEKQARAIAEALLEEVEMMPFTTCDPDGYNSGTGTCALPEAMGPEAGEARGSATPFDNVNDYNGFSLAGGGSDLSGSAGVVVPAGYTASVSVTQDGAFGEGGSPLPSDAVLRIAVTVSYNGGSVVVEGYRTRYAPTVAP